MFVLLAHGQTTAKTGSVSNGYSSWYVVQMEICLSDPGAKTWSQEAVVCHAQLHLQAGTATFLSGKDHMEYFKQP